MSNGNLHNGHHPSHHNHATSNCHRSSDVKNMNGKQTKPGPEADADHTALSGLAIDWGHGWGWGQAAWAAQSACLHDHAVATAAVVPSAGLFCNGGEDYGIGGYEEVDWSSFGDFSF